MTTFIVIAVVLILAAIGGMMVGPSYMEYGKVKKAVVAIALEGRSTTVGEVRKAFDRRAQIDDINVISGGDLDITKEGGDVVVSFSYTKKVPLFSNISLQIDFAGSSNQ